MTGPEFDVLMNIAYSRWGAKSYPDIVKRRIWYYWNELPQKSFEQAMYTLLDISRAAPMPNEFRMLAYAEKERLGIQKDREPETQPRASAKCWDCGDSGNLFAHKTLAPDWHAVFRCHCRVGGSRPASQGIQWDDSCARSWIKEPMFGTAHMKMETSPTDGGAA